jgi:hypothetical protein
VPIRFIRVFRVPFLNFRIGIKSYRRFENAFVFRSFNFTTDWNASNARSLQLLIPTLPAKRRNSRIDRGLFW